MKLIISGADKGSAKHILGAVVDTFIRINESGLPIKVIIEGEKDND